MARLVFSVLIACAACSTTSGEVIPDEPANVRVQLAVPPNAPGEEQFLEVGRFRAPLRDVALGRGERGETLVRVAALGAPAATRVYRLDGDGLVEVPADSPVPANAFEPREDQVVSEAGIRDLHARWVASPPGRTVAVGSPGAGESTGRLQVVRESASGAAHPVAPVLEARGGCSPTPLALAIDPLRLAWLDCASEVRAPLLARVRVSVLDDQTWTTSVGPDELLPLEQSVGDAAPHVDARFTGDGALLVVVSRGSDGAGALVEHAAGAWRVLAPLPEIRVGRAGPPVLSAHEGEVQAAWYEPTPDGAQVLLRREQRERWPQVGRGGVDTRLPAALTLAPAVGWADGAPLVAIVEPSGLYVLRWDGEEWRRWGGRVAQGDAIGGAALAEHDGGTLVAWSSAGAIWTARRSPAGWRRDAAPVAEGVRVMRLAGGGRLAAVAWIDDERGTAHARLLDAAGSWAAALDLDAGGPADAIDVAAGARRVIVAVRSGSAVRTLRVADTAPAADDLGAVALPETTAPFAVTIIGGQVVVALAGPEGVRLTRHVDRRWVPMTCPAAAGLGPSVDALDLAPAEPGAVWLAARQTLPEVHVRAVRCPLL